MASLRNSTLRIIRCIQHRQTKRTASTLAPTIPNASRPPPPPQSFLRKYRSIIIWTSLGLTTGSTAGMIASHTIAPPPHPQPGTHQDSILLQDLDTRIDTTFKVKVLRGKCTAVAASLRGDQAVWSELDPKRHAESGSLVDDTLSGARSLGVQRVFWNQKEHELVAVVWFGGAVSGWPGVAHGGAIATVMADKIALAASLVNGDDAAADAYPSEPTRLDLTYKKPTYANDFYVVRAKPRHVDSASLSAGHVQVHAQLETLDGTICVLVDGDVPVSEAKGTVKTAVKSLTPAKSWMGWTSRSDT